MSTGSGQCPTFPPETHGTLCPGKPPRREPPAAPPPKPGLEPARHGRTDGDGLLLVPLSLVRLESKAEQTHKQMAKDKQAVFTLRERHQGPGTETGARGEAGRPAGGTGASGPDRSPPPHRNSRPSMAVSSGDGQGRESCEPAPRKSRASPELDLKPITVVSINTRLQVLTCCSLQLGFTPHQGHFGK